MSRNAGRTNRARSFTSPSSKEAALWSPTGKATDPGAVLGPAWTDTQAVGINNSGDIIGLGDYHGGLYAFLLTAASATGFSATPFSAHTCP
jgi:hypothetical protein